MLPACCWRSLRWPSPPRSPRRKRRLPRLPALPLRHAEVHRLKAERPDLCLVVVDYLQMMGGSDRLSEEAQITRNSKAMKRIAEELGVAIILLSQLNRRCEERDNKRPQRADLRGSGSIEQDADILVFIYRDEYYNPESAARGIAELIIAKQRNGETKTVLAGFEGETVRFFDLEVS
jgi:replicative DNA helicase